MMVKTIVVMHAYCMEKKIEASTFARYPEANESSELYKKNKCECDPKYINVSYEKDPSSYAYIQNGNRKNGFRLIGGSQTLQFDNMTLSNCLSNLDSLKGNGLTTIQQPGLFLIPDEKSFSSLNGITRHGYSIGTTGDVLFAKGTQFDRSAIECYWKNEDDKGHGYTISNFIKGAHYPLRNEHTKGDCTIFYNMDNITPFTGELPQGKCMIHFNGKTN